MCDAIRGLPDHGGTGDAEHDPGLLEKCGLAVWTPSSPGAEDGAIYERALCLVIDMPGAAGLRTLRLLRGYGVTTPAILVADSGHALAADEMKGLGVLDVVPRAADARALLHWIESMCITQRLLERLRSGEAERAAARAAA